MRIKIVVGRAGLILLGVALALMFAEGVVRWISPQPIEYFTFLESPAPGSVIINGEKKYVSTLSECVTSNTTSDYLEIASVLW